jgi:hypothetical protein
LKRDDEEYVLGVVEGQFNYFGPFPAKIAEIADPETVQSILLIIQNIPREKTTPFSRATRTEVSYRETTSLYQR